MKKTRRFAAIAAAAMMTAALAVPMTGMNAFAADESVTYTINNTNGNNAVEHSYKAYKIFAGTVATAGESKELTGITWAMSDGDTFLANLKSSVLFGETNPFADATDAATVAAVLAGNEFDSEIAKNFAAFCATQENTLGTAISGVTSVKFTSDGYYVIIDKGLNEGKTDKQYVYSRPMLVLADAKESATPETIDTKSSLPSVEKKIKENVKTGTWSDADTYGAAGWNDVADFSINDTVSFMLNGTLPETLADYKTYKYVFHDTLDAQFTPDLNTVTVTIDGVKVDPSCYEVSELTENKEGDVIVSNSFTVAFDDIKAATVATGETETITVTKDSKVRVVYDATLNANAIVGRPGQYNEVYLEYSNNPNVNGEGEQSPDTGETPEDKVVAFTYELDVTKVDGATTTALEGAKFILQATDGEHAGKFATLEYNDTKKGYIVTGWVEGSCEKDADSGEWEFTATGDGTATEMEGKALSDDDKNNNFNVVGLDDGSYALYETEVPTGYNAPDAAFALTISATTINSQSLNPPTEDALSALEITVGEKTQAGDVNTGKVTTSVENNSGSTLPGTGGIGTVLFYVVGGVLVVGAGVTLITKKRVGKESE